MSIAVDLEKFHRDGYLVFRGVFSPERIAEYRRRLDASPGLGGDILSMDDFAELITDPAVLEVARKILGGKPTYFGCSSISRATTAGTAGWHRDNADRIDTKGPDWTGGPYTPIRFGIYMQDHKNHSGGLLLRPTTHTSSGAGDRKKLVYVDSEVGDLVVWNMKLLHAGGGKRRRDDIERPVDVLEARNAAPEDFLPEPEGPRYAAFLTYGLSGDEHTERFIDYLATRTYQVNLWKRSKVCDRSKILLWDADVEYRDIWSEIKDRPDIGQCAGHVEKAHLKGEIRGIEIAASH